MSQENVDLIRQGYDAWSRQDDAWLQGLVSDDFEFRPAGEFPGLQEVYRGPSGWNTFIDDWRQAWDSHRFAVERVEDLGENRVLVLVISVGCGRGSGATVEMETGHLWTLEDGVVRRMLAYASWAHAVEAAGLSG